MAFSLWLDHDCLCTSCTFVEYTTGHLQWDDGGEYIGIVYRDNDSSEFTYYGPDDLYLTTTYAGGTGPGGGGNTPQTPTSWNLKIYVKKDNIPTKNLDVTHYSSVGVSASTMKVTYYTDTSNSSQEVHTIDLPVGYKISSVTVNNNTISSEQTFSKQNVTVQYNLTKDTYTVTLDNQSATIEGTESVTATFGKKMPPATMPQKTGYTFGGYYTGTSGSGTQYYKADGSSTRTWNIKSNTTLYAKWTANTYTVKFNANGGSGTMGPQKFTYGTAQNLTANTFTRTGYTFAGWATSANGNKVYNDKQYVSNLSSTNGDTVNLYAKWTANPYTISYTNLKGATNPTSNPSTYTIETPTITFVKPTNNLPTGYTWTKWNPSSITKGNIGDKTITAEWTANEITITWNANGGTCATTSSSYIYDGATVSLPTPSRPGYDFKGWFTASSGGTQITNVGGTNKPDKDVTYYARWELIPYTIDYYIDGVKDTSLGNPATYTIETPTITLKNPTKSNYTGSGWRLRSTSGAEYKQIVKGSTGDKTFYWTWTPGSYTITYKDQGNVAFSGTHDSGYPTKHTYGTATTLKSATKKGYTFGGWFANSNCSGTALNSLSATGYTSDIPLYAKWTANKYTVKFNANGGSGTMSDQKFTYGIAQNLTANAFTRTRFTFVGWATSENGSKVYNDKQYVSNLSSTNGDTVNLYATWTAKIATITWNPNGGNWNGSTANIVDTCWYGETITKPSDPTREGHTFEEWKDQYGKTTIATTMPENDLTYTAQWTVNSYIINLNGGSSSQTSVKINYGSSTFLNTSTSSVTTIITPSKEGRTFKGWYTASGGNGSLIIDSAGNLQPNVRDYTNESGQWIRTQNTTVYAYYTGNPCTITVVANPSDLTSRLSGGGNYKNGDSITLIAPSEYGAYKFESWTKNGSFVSSEPQYTFTANGSATYVANFIDNRKSAVFRIHVLDDTYVETSLCEVEIKYGDLDNPSENSIKRAGNMDIEIDGPSSIISVTKTHISGTTDISDKCGGLTSQVIYIFPTSINNEPFINILYNGKEVESEDLYTNDALTFDVYYGNMPKPSGGGSNPGGDSGSSIPSEQLKVRFNYWLGGVKLEKGTATWDSKWGAYTPPEEIETWWIQYNGFKQDKKDYNKNRIYFTYHETGGYTNIANTPTQLQVKLDIQAPINCYFDEIDGVDIRDYSKEYNTLTNPSGLDVNIYYKNVTYSARATSNNTSMGSADVNNSGTNGSSDVDFIIGQRLTFNAIPETGYKFTKWVNKNNTSQKYTYNPYVIKSAPAADVHYEAYFGPVEYTITLNPNGGSGSNQTVYVDYLSSSLKSTITNPTRTGYTFDGWYTTASGGSKVIGTDGKLKPNVSDYTNGSSQWIKASGTTLYAHWTPTEYTITLNPNGGSGSNQTVYVDYLSSSLKSTITNPTRTGYTFDGWYTTASGGSKVIGTDGKLKPNVKDYTNGSSQWTKASGATLYAHWTAKSWTLTWDLNGGTVTTAGTCAPLKSTGIVSGEVNYASSITAPVVSKDGYTFSGWSTNGVDVITPKTTMPNNDLKYIAVYSINTYQITVNDNLSLGKVYIKVKGENKGTTYTCTTGETITLVAENTIEYVLSSWKKSGWSDIPGLNEFTFTVPGNYLDNPTGNNIFTAYYEQDPRATLKINFRVDDAIEKTAILKFDTTFHFLGDSTTDGYRCEIQGRDAECVEGDISINQQGYFFIPSKYNGKDICMVPHEQGSGTTELICSNKGTTIGYDGSGSQYYLDNTTKNHYCPTKSYWQAYLPTNTADETHLVFPAVEKEEYGVLYGPLVIDVYYGEIPERFLPVIPEDVEITTVSGLTLLQRIQNKIATFKWLNNLFGEPEKTSWNSYDNSGLKSFLKDDSKETPSSIHCIEYGDLQIYNQGSGNGNINLDKTIKQYSLTSDKIIKPLNGQVELKVSKIEGNKIYFNISNLSEFTNTSNGIYIYFSVNNETDENNATLYKMKLPKKSSNKGLLLTIPEVSNIESLYIYRTPIMVDSTKTGIIPKILFSSEKEELPISIYDNTTLNITI